MQQCKKSFFIVEKIQKIPKVSSPAGPGPTCRDDVKDARLQLLPDVVSRPAHERPVVQLALRPVAEDADAPVGVVLVFGNVLDLGRVVERPPRTRQSRCGLVCVGKKKLPFGPKSGNEGPKQRSIFGKLASLPIAILKKTCH